MKLISQILLILFLPLQFALAVGGDADGGGGPSTTITALKHKGLTGGVYSDLIEALKDNKFNRDFLDQSGLLDGDSLERFKGVNFHPNGSFSFMFVKDEENKDVPVRIIKVKRVQPDLGSTSRFMHASPIATTYDFSAWRTSEELNENDTEVDWQANWAKPLTIGTGLELQKEDQADEESEQESDTSSEALGSEANESKAKDKTAESTQSKDLFETIVTKYGSQKVYRTFDEVAAVVGTQIQTGEKEFFKVHKLKDFDSLDIARMLEVGPSAYQADSPKLEAVNFKDLYKPAKQRGFLQPAVENVDFNHRLRDIDDQRLREMPALDPAARAYFNASGF